jgi:hypothetical protein
MLKRNALGGTIDYFRDTVFNYPTMAECYKVAALDGLNKLSLSLSTEVENEAAAFIPPINSECDTHAESAPALTSRIFELDMALRTCSITTRGLA